MHTQLPSRSMIAKRNLVYWIDVISEEENINFPFYENEQSNLLKAFEAGIAYSTSFDLAIIFLVKCMPLIEYYQNENKWVFTIKAIIHSLPKENIENHSILLNRLAALQFRMSKYETSLKNYLYAETIACDIELAFARMGLSQIYWAKAEYKKAKHYGIRALNWLLKTDRHKEAIVGVKNTLGMIAQSNGIYKIAESYFRSAKNLCSQFNLDISLSLIYNNLAIALYEQNKLDQALRYISKARRILKTCGNSYEKMRLDLNHALIHFKLGNTEVVLKSLHRAYRAGFPQKHELANKAYVHINYGAIHYQQGHISECNFHLNKAINYFSVTGFSKPQQHMKNMLINLPTMR